MTVLQRGNALQQLHTKKDGERERERKRERERVDGVTARYYPRYLKLFCSILKNVLYIFITFVPYDDHRDFQAVMTPPALRGTLGRAHFGLEDRLPQPDGLLEGFPAVHAEHHDEQVPCARLRYYPSNSGGATQLAIFILAIPRKVVFT